MKESLIYVILLVKRGNEYVYNYCYHFTNPIDDDLKCIRNENIDDVQSIEEIENEHYTIDDNESYEIRLREIRAEYKIISEELLDYTNLIEKELGKQEGTSQIELLLDQLDIKNFSLNEYKEIKKRITRNNKLNDLGI